MIKKLFKGLEINEKDNMLTAIAKGGVEGSITGAVGTLAIWGVVYAIGKHKQVKEVQEEGAE